MKAFILQKQQDIHNKPLILKDVPTPTLLNNELLIKIKACGICRTDLHVIEGDLKPHTLPIIPGHQVVGEVTERGKDVSRFKKKDIVGIAWLRHTCGSCEYCQNNQENLCSDSQYTGWDHHGGYAEYTTVPQDFAYPISEAIKPKTAAPLLCAGIIGYRALKQSGLKPFQNLGMYGFGSSAHICLQIAKSYKCKTFVFTRNKSHQRLAKKMGANWTGGIHEKPPEKCHSMIIFAPAGSLIPHALESLKKGGTLSLAGIHMSDCPPLNYQRHLFHEHTIRSVEANTRQDGLELLDLAKKIPIIPHIQVYDFTKANEALIDLKDNRINGSGVLVME